MFQELTKSYRFFAKDIVLSHSIFALPFALSSLHLSQFENITIQSIFLIILCMFFARSFAMGINRVVDWRIDKENLRTAQREIPSGRLSWRVSLGWSLFNGVLFSSCASQLSSLAGKLSIPMLFILAGYSFQKRWTFLCHWYLGFCLGLAPIAVGVALDAQNLLALIVLGFSIMFWTAGFDILYSTQDLSFDRQNRLHSAPVRFGVEKAVLISQMCFVGMICGLFLVGFLASMGVCYQWGVVLLALFLAYEQWLVRGLKINGVSPNLNKAFFQMNGWVSVFFFLCVALDRWIEKI